MKTFQSKSLLESRTVGLLKGLTLLFLWASVVVLTTYGLDINPGISNSTQYIQKIILTSNGNNSWTTWVVLNWAYGGRIGIGVENPSTALDIDWNISFAAWTTRNITIDSNSSTVWNNLEIYAGNGTVGWDVYIAGGNRANLSSKGNVHLAYPYGNVGIGDDPNPTASLQVEWTMKHLSSVETTGAGIGIYTWKKVLYFPQWVPSWLDNTGINADTIWYISCVLWNTWFTLLWFTWEYMDGYQDWSGSYFKMFGWKNSTLTYHLKAQETFAVVFGSSSTGVFYTWCTNLTVMKQMYGRNAVTYNGWFNWAEMGQSIN